MEEREREREREGEKERERGRGERKRGRGRERERERERERALSHKADNVCECASPATGRHGHMLSGHEWSIHLYAHAHALAHVWMCTSTCRQ